MSRYTHTAVCVIPAPLGIIAAAVGRALDPDTGGALSFIPLDQVLDADGKVTKPATKLVASTPVTAEYATVLPYLLADPTALLATIALDRDARWPEWEIPTLADVTKFCAAATLEVC